MRAVEGVQRSLRVLRLGESPATAWAEPLEHLRCALNATMAQVYTLREGPLHPELGWQLGAGQGTGPLAELNRKLIHGKRDYRILYDPLSVEASQRNTVLTFATLKRRHSEAGRAAEGIQQDCRHLFGWRSTDQIRVLVCAGRTLLGWIGGFRAEETFAKPQVQVLRKLIPAFRERLAIDQQLDRVAFLEATAQAALDALHVPAYVVDRRGVVDVANTLGRKQLESDRRETITGIQDALRGSTTHFRTVRFPILGSSDYSLLIAHAETTDAHELVELAAKTWSLSPRQTTVLHLLVQGWTNATIARELSLSVRTVELHVSRVFDAAGVENRASLLARVWRGRG